MGNLLSINDNPDNVACNIYLYVLWCIYGTCTASIYECIGFWFNSPASVNYLSHGVSIDDSKLNETEKSQHDCIRF